MSDVEFLIYTILVVLIILLILWLFFGGNEYKDHELNIADQFMMPKKNLSSTNLLSENSNKNFEMCPTEIFEMCPTENLSSTNLLSDNSNKNFEMCKTENLSSNNLLSDNSNKNFEMCPTENNNYMEAIISDKKDYVQEIILDEKESSISKINLVIKFLPSYDIEYYRDFILTTEKGIKKMEKKTANESRGEKLCRSILEKFFNKPFTSARPNFLLNPETNRNLELDCFNKELMLALEYNGAQHYDWPNTFHKTLEEFNAQRRRDDLKRRICESSGIYLITVPFRVPHHNLPKYIEYYLPENVQHRRENGIDELTEDSFWDSKTTIFPKNGFV